jgi:homoserine O-acetyltransferase/O-succinyltransferase
MATSPDHDVFEAGDVKLQSGEVFPRARIAYKTYGTLDAAKSNVILYPTSFNAQHVDTQWLIAEGKALDPTRYFIIIPNRLGNGMSSSPSNFGGEFDVATYPYTTIADNVRLQQRLFSEVLGIHKIALVYGFSMGGIQAFHWGALFPDMVERICATAAAATTSVHNHIMLEGVKAALTADPTWNGKRFEGHPERGLRAFGRIFAGWGVSQAFYRQGLHTQSGAKSIEDFLVTDFDTPSLKRNGNDLLAQIWTWQHADIGDNDVFRGDRIKALQSIRARTLVMPSETDLYFTVVDAKAEAAHMPNAEFRPIPSVWGHRAGNPMRNPADQEFIFDAVRKLLAS